jgi:hypothetical protein
MVQISKLKESEMGERGDLMLRLRLNKTKEHGDGGIGSSPFH